jgi:hypothetical protein
VIGGLATYVNKIVMFIFTRNYDYLKICEISADIMFDTVHNIGATWQSVEPTWTYGGRIGSFEERNKESRYSTYSMTNGTEVTYFGSSAVRFKFKIYLLRVNVR